MRKMRLFTPGPVPIEEHLRAIGAKQLPYNRTEEFTELTHEILRGLKYVFRTEGSVALLTGSGTAAMEASVMNFLGARDKALIINGGVFGQRWCDLCERHSIPHDVYTPPLGSDIDLNYLGDLVLEKRSTALLATAHETSTGHLYDIQSLGLIARNHGLFFLVDAISSICADPFHMDEWGVDAAILSTQKALALPPGMSFVAMNDRATARLAGRQPGILYFDLKNCLVNQERGQTPYTPAIGLMLQLVQRLRDIQEQTLPALTLQHKERAETFRRGLVGLPFEVFPFRSSNAITALSRKGIDASKIAEELRERFDIIVAPNAGRLKSKIFRVAHMGAQDNADLTILNAALRSVAESNAHEKPERIQI